MSVEEELDHATLATLVQELCEDVVALRKENAQLKQRIAELEDNGNPTQRLGQSYSLQAEEQRERDRRSTDIWTKEETKTPEIITARARDDSGQNRWRRSH